MGGTSLSSLISHFTDSIDSSLPSSFRPKKPTSPSNCYKFFVLALIFWPCIFIIRPVFSVKIQVYHILLRYRYAESHFHDVLLLSLRTPFFIASLSAQIACNSHTPVTLYATSVASQQTLASWSVLPSLESLVRGENVRINGHCVKRPKQCWNLKGSTWDEHSPQNILIIFGWEMGYLPLRSPVHPIVSADSNGRSTDFPAVFLLHIFRLPVGVNYFGRHLHHQTCIFRQDSCLSHFATIQACGVSFLSCCSPILTDPIFVASLSAQIARNLQI